MRHQLVLPIFLLACVAAPAMAAADCPATRTSLTVRTSEDRTRYDQSKSMIELARLVDAPRRADLDSYVHTLGVTSPRFESSGSYQAVALKGRDDWCARVSSATIEVTLRQTVYLAREIERSSCAYRVVLNHERKHARLNTRFLEKLKGVIKDAVGRADLQGSRALSAAAAQQAAMNAMDQVITEAVRRFGTELRIQQESVDTPEEYDRLYAICGEDSMRRLTSRTPR